MLLLIYYNFLNDIYKCSWQENIKYDIFLHFSFRYILQLHLEQRFNSEQRMNIEIS